MYDLACMQWRVWRSLHAVVTTQRSRKKRAAACPLVSGPVHLCQLTIHLISLLVMHWPATCPLPQDGADEPDAGPKAAPANRSNTLSDIHHQPNGADSPNNTGAGSALYGSMQALAGTLPAASSGYGCAVSGMGVGMMGAGGGGMGMGMGGMDGQGAHGAVVPHAHARSRFALREWISEEYEITGLTRKLSKLDLQVCVLSACICAYDHVLVSLGCDTWCT